MYDPTSGYYSKTRAAQDYATSPRLSLVFAFGLARLVAEFVGRLGDEVFTLVDIGCGDGLLLKQLISELPPELAARIRPWGVDRAAQPRTEGIRFVSELSSVEIEGPALILSNELFDALPFARLVQRSEGLRELFVSGDEWEEAPASNDYASYFADRDIRLAEGQFADVSLEWSQSYRRICDLAPAALIVTFDYGYPGKQLFDNRVRRFGTAAAYARHQVHRDLLARPGEQDLTAHINFSDLQEAGESSGFTTLLFGRQAEFLLRLGVTEHPLFTPAQDVDAGSLEDAVRLVDEREAARRLVLPDGIGEEMRVLVQARGVPREGWMFQRRVF